MRRKITVILMALAVGAAFSLTSCAFKAADTHNNQQSVENVDVSEAEEFSGKAFSYRGVTVFLPEGYTTDEQNGITYVYNPDYPNQGDNLTFTSSNESIDDYTEDALNKMLGSVFDDFEGVTGYTKYEIDGYRQFLMIMRHHIRVQRFIRGRLIFSLIRQFL